MSHGPAVSTTHIASHRRSRAGPHIRAPGAHRSATQSNPALLVFVAASLLVQMSVTQEVSPELGSLTYWLLVLPAALLPLANTPAIAKTLFGQAWLLLLLMATAGTWHLATGDGRAVIQLSLLVWVLAWVASAPAKLAVRDLVLLYKASVVLGFIVYLLSDLNRWGPLPGLTVDEYGVWRVSFFPNIAYTGFFSLAMVLVLSKNLATMRRYPATLAIALFYLVFSFVRTAFIALMIYAVLRWWFHRHPSSKRMFWTALLVAISANLAVAGSVFILETIQDVPLLSRLFMRGESGLSAEEIFQQIYRPWLWWQHLQQFASSPTLMGWGAFDFDAMKSEALVEGHEEADTVSLPTRLLAVYGVPGLLFLAFLVSELRSLANRRDAWACACFPAIFVLMMQWGSVFHPSDAMFILFLLMITRGSWAYPNRISSGIDAGNKSLRLANPNQNISKAKTKLKVLYIDTVGAFGGSSRSLFEAVQVLVTGPVEAYFVMQQGTAKEFYDKVAKEIVTTRGMPKFDNTRATHYRGIRWLVMLRELFYFPYSVQAVLEAHHRWKDIDLIHVNEVIDIIPGLIARSIFKVPMVVHVRSLQRTDRPTWRTRWVNSRLRNSAAAVVAINQNTRATLPADLQVDVIQNSFTPSRSSKPDPALLANLDALRPTSLKVGFVGNLHHAKGLFDLLDAAKLIADEGADVEFLIVGGVTLADHGLKAWALARAGLAQNVLSELQARIREYNLQDRFHLLGATNDIQCVYERLDVVAFPSHYDAPGRPVFEAAFSGVPSIVCVEKPQPDTLVHSETGLAIPAKDPRKLAKAILHFANDRAEVQRMGANAKALAHANFVPAKNAEKLLKVYNRVIDVQVQTLPPGR